MGPYVDSQWGLAQFSLPNESLCVCAFIGDKKSVVGEWMPRYMYELYPQLNCVVNILLVALFMMCSSLVSIRVISARCALNH